MKMDRIGRLEKVFRNDFNLLCYICNQYPIPQSEHPDLIQEALTRTIIKIDSILNGSYGGIRSYLIKVIKNLCLDYLRPGFVIETDRPIWKGATIRCSENGLRALKNMLMGR